MSETSDVKTTLAVIVVCYHSKMIIQACIDALDVAINEIKSPQIGVTLVLVANSPEDDVAQVGSSKCQIICVDAPGNVGFSPAVNLGLAVVPTVDFILLLNPDAQLAPNCLARLLCEAQSQDAALVGPILCDGSGDPNGVSERPFHSVRRELSTQFLAAERKRPPYGRGAYRTGRARCLTGACLLVAGSFLRSTGGLDTEVRMYLEDVMLCWQAHQQGRKVLLARDAMCHHALGASTGGANFASSLGLHLTLLSARVAFVQRTAGTARAGIMRFIMGCGAAVRIVLTRGHRRDVHLAVLRWSVNSGRPPVWRDGPVVDDV